MFLSHRFQYPTKISSENNVTYLELSPYLGQKKPVAQNYLFIAIFLIEILFAKMSRVNKALMQPNLHQYSLIPMNAEVQKQNLTSSSFCYTENFINVLRAHFSYKILAPKITKPNVTREKLPERLTYKKIESNLGTQRYLKICRVNFERTQTVNF
jgi:hypothetical protein